MKKYVGVLMLVAALGVVSIDATVAGAQEMSALAGVSQALAKKFGDPESAKFVWRPQMEIPVTGEAAENLVALLDQLDDLDDVQSVYSNEDISEEELARISA